MPYEDPHCIVAKGKCPLLGVALLRFGMFGIGFGNQSKSNGHAWDSIAIGIIRFRLRWKEKIIVENLDHKRKIKKTMPLGKEEEIWLI